MKIVRTKRYIRDLKRLGTSDSEVAALEGTIAANPTSGSVIPGLSGIRKIRFGVGGKGKRGGARAVYFLMVADDIAVMLFAFAKSEREDMNQDEKKSALALLKDIKRDRRQ